GIDAAARRYFDKTADKLSVGEAALLAGLLKAPSRYAPTSNPEGARERAGMVLDAMAANGALTADARTAAGQAPIVLDRGRPVDQASYFTDYVLAEIDRLAEWGDNDIVVRTTLDAQLQKSAEASLQRELAAHDARASSLNGAIVTLAPDGAVRAMVGGRDYDASQFNRAVQARRQPGSAFKPFVYLAALERGWTPYSVMYDGPVQIGAWRPANYADQYFGDVTLSFALAHSLNSVAVRLHQQTGGDRVAATARRLGLDAPRRSTPAMALGVEETSLLNLTNAYAPFANGGLRAHPFAVERISLREGPRLYRRVDPKPEAVIAPRRLAEIDGMLARVVREGTGMRARLPDTRAAGKTGTSQGARDAWFVGYADGMVTGVWMGTDDNTPLKGVAGGGPPAAVWRRVMEAALETEGLAQR
ncbi:MAG: penicillin-binding transpeptidase domain-containing protein, partial [Pseudomonadota bacterium]